MPNLRSGIGVRFVMEFKDCYDNGKLRLQLGAMPTKIRLSDVIFASADFDKKPPYKVTAPNKPGAEPFWIFELTKPNTTMLYHRETKTYWSYAINKYDIKQIVEWDWLFDPIHEKVVKYLNNLIDRYGKILLEDD